MRREFLIALAISLAVLAGGLVVYQWTAAPTTLKVAVGPMGSENTRLVVALQQYMARERSTVRLRLVLTEGVDASAKAVEDDKADLAIVRTDVAMPVKAQTVAIMHRDAALLMTTPESGISKVSGLWGRNVGVVREIAANRTLLETGLAHYEIPRDSVVIVTLGANEVEEALRTKRVDAVLAVGTVTGRTMTETVAAVSQAANMAPVFIPIDEADAIAQRSPKFESLEVVRGSFGGTPPRPAATVETLGVSHRLVAKTSLDDNVVSEVTKVLFTARPTLAQEVALANKIEAPDTAKGSALPVHSGATAYYEGEVQTFFERYGDWFYLVIMVLSIGGVWHCRDGVVGREPGAGAQHGASARAPRHRPARARGRLDRGARRARPRSRRHPRHGAGESRLRRHRQRRRRGLHARPRPGPPRHRRAAPDPARAWRRSAGAGASGGITPSSSLRSGKTGSRASKAACRGERQRVRRGRSPSCGADAASDLLHGHVDVGGILDVGEPVQPVAQPLRHHSIRPGPFLVLEDDLGV